MNNEFNKPIDLLPEEMRRKETPKQEKKESKTEFFIPLKEEKIKEEKKTSGNFFSFFKNIFKKKGKSQREVKEVKKEEIALKENQEKESFPSDSTRPEISLMPTQTFVTLGLIKKKKKNLFIIALLSFFIILILFVMVNYFLNKKTKEVEFLNNELKNTETKISDTKIILRNIKNYELIISQAEQLLARQPHWSSFFFLLEKYTLPEVYYQGFSGDLSGKIVLPTVAKDFSTFVKQLIVFQTATDFVKEVNFSGLNFSSVKEDEGGVSFSLELILNETAFYPQP